MGYIYIRLHKSYGKLCKLGKTKNIINRDNQYATSELKRGVFCSVYFIHDSQLNYIDKMLQNEFKKYNVRHDGGTEFYDKKIITLIESCFLKWKIDFQKILSEKYENQIIEKNNLIPRKDQRDIINKSIEFFKNYNKGIIVLTCGTGKTLISLWISKKLNVNKLLIGVPNRLLLNQWFDICSSIFVDYNIMIICSNVKIEMIINFINNHDRIIMITTYMSSYKVDYATKKCNLIFCMKINDEVHHLSSKNIDDKNKRYIKMLKINSIKQLSLTATLKCISGKDNIISNDNINYFGNVIVRHSLLWAINKNIVCDYKIQTILSNKNNLGLFNDEIDENKRLILSAYSALKSISNGDVHHLFIYSNDQENSMKIIKYIKKIKSEYFNLPNLYFGFYHSNLSNNVKQNVLTKFKLSKQGIISCIYCLSEGFDIPLLDGVVFSQNMTSKIRIVQSVLRACRKNINEPNKIMKIILPIMYENGLLDEGNSDLKKVREVIYQMSLEDNTIMEKINLVNLIISKNKCLIKKINKNDTYEFKESFLLKTINRNQIDLTYDSAKKIINEYEINNKQDYYDLCYYENKLPLNPEEFFNNKFKNWLDYLGLDDCYYNFHECKNRITELLKDKNNKFIKSDLSNLVIQLCNKDNKFPPSDLWLEYYDITELSEIIEFPVIKKRVFSK